MLAPLLERATQAWRKGAKDTAARLCLELLDLLPAQPDGLWLLSRLREEEQKPRAVEALLRRIVTLHPNHLAATQDLALKLLRRNALVEAERHARNAVRLAPTNAVSHNLLAMVLTELQQLTSGEFHYLRVLELSDAREPITLANLAWCLKQQGRIDEARVLYEESLAAAPDQIQTLLGFVRLEEADRCFERASDLLSRAEAVAPLHPAVRLSRAVLYGRLGEPEKALAVLQAGAQANGDHRLGPDHMLEKGRLLDRLGRYEEAFSAFVQGKSLASQASGHRYLSQRAESQAQRMREFFTAGRMNSFSPAACRPELAQPLFITGFPRSGTTLVEQMLTSHPQIGAGDELPFIGELTEAAPRILSSPLSYPEALAELWMGDKRQGLDVLRDLYLQRAAQRGLTDPSRRWFTDKMPLNETHLALIGLVFPSSPIIHLIRHPLDVVLSVLSNQLTHGMFCAYELQSAARHYVLSAELTAAYRAQMPLRFLVVRYEEIVSEPEAMIRSMLTFLGEKFSASCLKPHENRRYARTASYAQVTRPLHNASVGKWKNYRRQLEPVFGILAPVADRLGYSLD